MTTGDQDGTCAVAATFTERAEKLRRKYTELRNANPNAEIDLICHSQGCIIAALAQLEGIKNTILLAPVINYADGETQRAHSLKKPSATLQDDDTIIRKRSGGYTTIIPAAYWQDFDTIQNLPSKYDELNTKTNLVIFDATQDTVVAHNKDYSLLKADIIFERIDLDHDFIEPDDSRSTVVAAIKKYL